MVKSKKFVVVKRFQGEPKVTDLKLVQEELRPIKDGEVLCEAVWFSVDPYMGPYMSMFPLGSTMIGSQVAKILESKLEEFPVGKFVVGYFGWQLRTVFNMKVEPLAGFPKPYVLPDFGQLPLSLALGTLGMPGNTAYFGLLELCQPKPGEVVVVNAAAGSVGSHVGQIARIKGCKVVGFAGTDDKVRWLKEELKFDAAYNYKTTTVKKALEEAAPDGVDCYFDNVGGDMSNVVLANMKRGGRVAVCGSISTFSGAPGKKTAASVPLLSLVAKELRAEGFIVHRWLDRWMEGIDQNLRWIKEGKLVYRETVTEGFEKLPNALIGMLRGENTGKAVVKVAPSSDEETGQENQ